MPRDDRRPDAEERERAAQIARRVRAERYSRFVRVAKWALPIGALAVVATIFLSGRGGDGVDAMLSAEEKARLGAGLRLDNPRFAGTTDAGAPFVLTADAALPDGPMPDEIALERPRGTVTLEDGRTLEARARDGTLFRGSESLVFSGDVTVETTDGYRFSTASVNVDLAARTARAPGPVEGTGPRGSIEAGSMRVLGGPDGADGATVRFEDGVRVLFRPGPAD